MQGRPLGEELLGQVSEIISLTKDANQGRISSWSEFVLVLSEKGAISYISAIEYFLKSGPFTR